MSRKDQKQKTKPSPKADIASTIKYLYYCHDGSGRKAAKKPRYVFTQ